MTDKAILIRDSVNDLEMHIPAASRELLITKVIKHFLSPTCKLTIEDVVRQERDDIVADWCITWIEETAEQSVEQEKEMWESNELLYLFDEANEALNYTFKTEASLLRAESYSHDDLTALDIELIDYIECKVSEGYYSNSDDSAYIDSIGEIGETETQVCRGDSWTDEFFSYYDTLHPEEKARVNDSQGYTMDFNKGSNEIYGYAGVMFPSWYVIRTDLEQAIAEAEKELSND